MWQEQKQLGFDEHAFAGRRAKAVSATKTADDWDSTGISFQDFGGMHVHKRSVGRWRRLETPQWALKDEMVRAVILRLAEDRLYIRDHSGADQERMARIKAAAENALPAKRQLLEKQMTQYAAYQEHKDNKGREEILREFAVQIQVLDSEITMLQGARFVALATALVYRYYRQGDNSVQISEEFRIKPPMVRVWLYRLNTVACKLGFPCSVARLRNKTHRLGSRQSAGKCSSIKLWDNKKVMALFALRTGGAAAKTCASVLGVREYAVMMAWRHYFGELEVRVHTRDRRVVPRRLRPLKTKGMSEFRIRMMNRLRTLFILRTSGKTWAECGRALKTTGPTACGLWKRHFGQLNCAAGSKKEKTLPKQPGRRRVWTTEKVAELKRLRVERKKFREIAEIMGLTRCQDAQSAYVRYVGRS